MAALWLIVSQSVVAVYRREPWKMLNSCTSIKHNVILGKGRNSIHAFILLGVPLLRTLHSPYPNPYLLFPSMLKTYN